MEVLQNKCFKFIKSCTPVPRRSAFHFHQVTFQIRQSIEHRSKGQMSWSCQLTERRSVYLKMIDATLGYAESVGKMICDCRIGREVKWNETVAQADCTISKKREILIHGVERNTEIVVTIRQERSATGGKYIPMEWSKF
jgi:hypothetical protein